MINSTDITILHQECSHLTIIDDIRSVLVFKLQVHLALHLKSEQSNNWIVSNTAEKILTKSKRSTSKLEAQSAYCQNNLLCVPSLKQQASFSCLEIVRSQTAARSQLSYFPIDLDDANGANSSRHKKRNARVSFICSRLTA